MPDIGRDLSDPGLIEFYEFWLALCGGRPMPSRQDIDPTVIPSRYLPFLMLIDVFGDPRRFRYRLVGTTVAAATGEDRTGRFFEEFDFFKSNPDVLQQFEAVAATGRPFYSPEPFTNLLTGTTYDVDRLLLPLSNDGQRVDMLLVLFQFKTGVHAHRLSKLRSRRVNAAGNACGA